MFSYTQRIYGERDFSLIEFCMHAQMIQSTAFGWERVRMMRRKNQRKSHKYLFNADFERLYWRTWCHVADERRTLLTFDETFIVQCIECVRVTISVHLLNRLTSMVLCSSRFIYFKRRKCSKSCWLNALMMLACHKKVFLYNKYSKDTYCHMIVTVSTAEKLIACVRFDGKMFKY